MVAHSGETAIGVFKRGSVWGKEKKSGKINQKSKKKAGNSTFGWGSG